MCFLSVLANEVLQVEEGASHYRFGPEVESKKEEEEEGTSDEQKIERQDYRHMEFMKGARADGLDPRLGRVQESYIARANGSAAGRTIPGTMVIRKFS